MLVERIYAPKSQLLIGAILFSTIMLVVVLMMRDYAALHLGASVYLALAGFCSLLCAAAFVANGRYDQDSAPFIELSEIGIKVTGPNGLDVRWQDVVSINVETVSGGASPQSRYLEIQYFERKKTSGAVVAYRLPALFGGKPDAWCRKLQNLRLRAPHTNVVAPVILAALSA